MDAEGCAPDMVIWNAENNTHSCFVIDDTKQTTYTEDPSVRAVMEWYYGKRVTAEEMEVGETRCYKKLLP